jgi:endo-1,4-beta-D-glucanase Y
MAWALCMADRQWGGQGSLSADYLSEARGLIERMYELEVDHDAYPGLLLPGDGWRGRNVFNPSYFAPNQYRVFGEVSGNVQGWQSVIERGYQVVENSLNDASGNRHNGLVPAWCTAEGAPVEAFPGAMQNYQYDSARLPFRIGQDWAYHRAAPARHYLARTSRFFAGIGADAIVDGYALDGTPAPDPNAKQPNPGSAVFIGSAAVGAMHDARYQSFIDAAYARIRTGELLARSRYYNHCWTVLSLLMLTGNLIEFPQGNPRV